MLDYLSMFNKRDKLNFSPFFSLFSYFSSSSLEGGGQTNKTKTKKPEREREREKKKKRRKKKKKNARVTWKLRYILLQNAIKIKRNE